MLIDLLKNFITRVHPVGPSRDDREKAAAELVPLLKGFLETVAEFVDKHDIIVPDLSVMAGGVQVNLTAKKLEDKSTKKKKSKADGDKNG